jgi:hypothetical protein
MVTHNNPQSKAKSLQSLHQLIQILLGTKEIRPYSSKIKEERLKSPLFFIIYVSRKLIFVILILSYGKS